MITEPSPKSGPVTISDPRGLVTPTFLTTWSLIGLSENWNIERPKSLPQRKDNGIQWKSSSHARKRTGDFPTYHGRSTRQDLCYPAHRWTHYTDRMSLAHEYTQQQTAELQQQIGSLEQEIGNSKYFLAPTSSPTRVAGRNICNRHRVLRTELFRGDARIAVLVSGFVSDRAHSAWCSPKAGRGTVEFRYRADLNRSTGFRRICFKRSLVMAVFTSQ